MNYYNESASVNTTIVMGLVDAKITEDLFNDTKEKLWDRVYVKVDDNMINVEWSICL